MAKYILTNKVVDDISKIWNYTLEKWSEYQADKYYQMLLENINDVAYNPDFGKDYSGVIEDLLGFRAGRHIIFYSKIDIDKILIVRIIHE